MSAIAETILQTNTLPQPITRLIHTEKIKVRQHNGVVHLIPFKEKTTTCPLLGLYADGKLTVEQHLAWAKEDKELEKL
jgi:hypothetical protein